MPLLNLIHQVLLKRVIVRLSFERFSLNRVADFEILSLLCLGDKSCNELVFFELSCGVVGQLALRVLVCDGVLPGDIFSHSLHVIVLIFHER